MVAPHIAEAHAADRDGELRGGPPCRREPVRQPTTTVTSTVSRPSTSETGPSVPAGRPDGGPHVVGRRRRVRAASSPTGCPAPPCRRASTPTTTTRRPRPPRDPTTTARPATTTTDAPGRTDDHAGRCDADHATAGATTTTDLSVVGGRSGTVQAVTTTTRRRPQPCPRPGPAPAPIAGLAAALVAAGGALSSSPVAPGRHRLTPWACGAGTRSSDQAPAPHRGADAHLARVGTGPAPAPAGRIQW